MAKEKKEKHFIQQPVYPGGPQALKKFIAKNLRYPEEALKAQVEGTVALRYVVDHKGAVSDVKVIAGLGSGCDEEAVRLVKSLKFRVPRQKRPGKVQFHKDIKIHFRLPKTSKQPAQYEYKLSAAASEPAPDESKQTGGGSYTYTISF